MSRAIPSAVRDRIDDDRRLARSLATSGRTDEAWRLLEDTHVLSQPWVWPHVRSHLDMLRLAVATRDWRELRGQVVRTVVAAPGTATRKYPLGNTGRATVPAMLPMPIRDDLASLLGPSAIVR